MGLTDTETQIEAKILQEIQDLIILRKQKFTQLEMSKKLSVSLKTIQNFENYKSYNLKIFIGYKLLLE